MKSLKPIVGSEVVQYELKHESCGAICLATQSGGVFHVPIEE